MGLAPQLVVGTANDGVEHPSAALQVRRRASDLLPMAELYREQGGGSAGGGTWRNRAGPHPWKRRGKVGEHGTGRGAVDAILSERRAAVEHPTRDSKGSSLRLAVDAGIAACTLCPCGTARACARPGRLHSPRLRLRPLPPLPCGHAPGPAGYILFAAYRRPYAFIARRWAGESSALPLLAASVRAALPVALLRLRAAKSCPVRFALPRIQLCSTAVSPARWQRRPWPHSCGLLARRIWQVSVSRKSVVQ